MQGTGDEGTERNLTQSVPCLQALARLIHPSLVCPCKIFANSLGGSKVKTLRKIGAVTLLSLMLTVSVLGGQVDSPGAPAPPPPLHNHAIQTPSTTSLIVLAVLALIYR
jgi:hypothetical protein